MTREEFLQGMSVLIATYSKDMTQEQIAIWYQFFEADSFDAFRNAIKLICTTSKFFPTVAEIKAAMADGDLKELTADQAWDQVLAAITKYGYYRADEAMKSLPDLTASAVRNLGGFQHICSAEMNEWLRKDFIKVYEDMKTRNVTKYVTGDLITIADVVAHQKQLEAKEEEINF